MSWRSWRGGVAKRLMAISNEKAIHKTLSVVGEAANQQVPHDEGTLQDSQYIDVKDGTGLISYGGGPGTGHPRVPYAVKHHEIEANFQKGRKKNYVRDPFNSLARPTYRKTMQKEGRSRL